MNIVDFCLEDYELAEEQLYTAIQKIRNYAVNFYNEDMTKNILENDKFKFYIDLCDEYFEVRHELDVMKRLESDAHD